MKLSRLLAYGVAGVISGLLLENATLKARQKVKDKTRKLGKKADKLVHAKA